MRSKTLDALLASRRSAPSCAGVDASVRKNTMLRKLWLFVPLLAVVNCFPYVYHVRDRVLVGGVEVDATLEIARIELEEGGFDALLHSGQ